MLRATDRSQVAPRRTASHVCLGQYIEGLAGVSDRMPSSLLVHSLIIWTGIWRPRCRCRDGAACCSHKMSAVSTTVCLSSTPHWHPVMMATLSSRRVGMSRDEPLAEGTAERSDSSDSDAGVESGMTGGNWVSHCRLRSG